MSNRTEWHLYDKNEEAWLAMLSDCAKAKESIYLEQFIFVVDDFGKRFIEVCSERARAGVKVYFLWDAAGSFTLFGSNIAHELSKSGIKLLFWRTLIPPYYDVPDFRSWFLRNHRRTIVIDNKIGYTGSICFADKMRNWRDTNVRLCGKIVLNMQNAFERMWYRAQKSKNIPPRLPPADKEFQYITNYPAPGRRHAYKALLKAIQQAEDYICITTPYFVPTHRLSHAITRAAKRGVRVRIILPEKSDHYAVDLGAQSYFNYLLSAGVRIFKYQGNMIHGKVVVIDDKWSSVGSMNLDSLSLLYDFEANIVTSNTEFARTLVEHFENDLRESREILYRDWRNRFFLERIPEILIRLVRKFL